MLNQKKYKLLTVPTLLVSEEQCAHVLSCALSVDYKFFSFVA